jgi:hypothetical protein
MSPLAVISLSGQRVRNWKFLVYFLTLFRLTKACLKKCVPSDYREGELNKGEGVCIDRCSAKFFDVQMKISEILQAEAQAKGAGGGGMGFGGA